MLFFKFENGNVPNSSHKLFNLMALVVFCVALATGLSYCDRVNMSVAVVSLAKELNWDDTEKAKVLGAFFYGYLLSQTLGASLSHKYGGKTVLGMAACCWSAFTLIVPALAIHSVHSLVLGRFLLGLSEGVTFPAAYYLLREHVEPQFRSRALAMVSIGNLCGAILSFILCPFLIEEYGWQSVFYVFGGIFGPLFTIFWFYWMPSSNSISILPLYPTPEKDVGYIELMKSSVVSSVCFSHFVHNLTHFSLMSWLPTFFHEKLHIMGNSLAIASLPWMVMGASVWFSSWTADRMIMNGSDKAFIRRIFTVVSFVISGISMIVVAILSLAHTPKPLGTLLFLSIALAGNGSATAAGYEAAKLDLTKSPSAASRLQSLSNTIATLAGVLGVPLVSALKGPSDEWQNVFIGLAIAFFCAAIVFATFGRWNGPIL